MRNTRRTASLMLVVTIVFMTFFAAVVPAYAATDPKIQNEANILNTLKVLQGNNGDFNLDGQLKRSEAGTFAIRLLGNETYVLQNKDKYSATRFSDVKKTDWFAPYVGYCTEQGIIAGYADGKYLPNDNISEKSFLKVVLCTLGYIYGVDFTWGNVYQTAYSVGLVTDPAYQTKTADNTQYKRGQVVDVLYNALSKDNKNEKTKQINVLIKNGAITRSIALATGIIRDTVPAAVQLVTPIDSTDISIKLNETISNITVSNLKVYESADTSKQLTLTLTSQANGEIIVKTSAQTPDKAYIVELANITDSEGNVSDRLVGSFTGFRSPEIKSDFFKISKVEPVSKNSVNLYFTQPVNANSEIASYYEIYQNNSLVVRGTSQSMTVEQLTSVNNGVTIILKDQSLADGQEYMIKVSGVLTSAYGVKLKEMSGDSITFKAKGNDSEGLKITNTVVLNSRIMEVDFNKEIQLTVAQQVFMYNDQVFMYGLTDTSNNQVAISKAVISGDGANANKTMLITISGVFDKTKNYNLAISGINTQNSEIAGKTYSFVGNYPDATDLQLVNAASVDAGTLIVYFSRSLDTSSAAIASNYQVVGITDNGYLSFPVKVYYDPATNPYMVKLFLPSDKPLKGTSTYKLRVMPTLQDFMGLQVNKTLEYGFNSTGSTTSKPLMSSAVIISSDTIRVTFNKEVAIDTPNLLNSNYSLEYTDAGATVKKIPLSVMFYNPTTMILKFDVLDFSLKYSLKFNSLKDYSGVNTRTAADGSTSVDVVAGTN